MTWSEQMIAHHKDEIEHMRQSIEWMESGKMDVGEVDSGGRMTSLKDESIASYKRIIAELENVVARMEAKS